MAGPRSTRRKTIPKPSGDGKVVEAPPPPSADAAPAAPAPARQRRRRSSGVELQEHTPSIGVNVERPVVTRVPPKPPFELIVDPSRWDVIGGRLVPCCYNLVARPGVNGVGADGAGRPLMSEARAAVAERGHIRIPWDVDGPRTSYLKRDAATGGCFLRWTKVFAGTDRVDVDTDGYAAWLDSLIERGVIPECESYVVKTLLSTYRTRRGDYIQNGGEKNAEAIERCNQAIKVLEAELERALAEEQALDAEARAFIHNDEVGDEYDPSAELGD